MERTMLSIWVGGLTHGLAGSIHFSVNGSEGGQLCWATGQAHVQLIICGHLIVGFLQILLILHPRTFHSAWL